MHLYLYNENCCYNSPLHTESHHVGYICPVPTTTNQCGNIPISMHVHVQVYAKSFYASVRMRKRGIYTVVCLCVCMHVCMCTGCRQLSPWQWEPAKQHQPVVRYRLFQLLKDQ